MTENNAETSGPARRKYGSLGGWISVVVGALLMLATLPGRTQGLGLITEPMLRDLHLDRLVYANINLWATLLGALFCLPIGWLIDRFGLRWTTSTIVLLLGVVVWRMSAHTGSVAVLFLLILLTRALGQSALSVASITAVGKWFGRKVGPAMAVYSVLLSLFFATAFTIVGKHVRTEGWRGAWMEIAVALMAVMTPITLIFLNDPGKRVQAELAEAEPASAKSLVLAEALRTPAFWIFGGATSLYGLVSSGLGLFNEAVLAERGFDQKVYHTFLAVTTLIALGGQLFSGWLTLRLPMQRLLGVSMFLYAAGLVFLPFLKTMAQFWVFATLMGISGGMITVLFFAIWRHAFGSVHLGRIQGAAQMLTVLASAVGPLLFAKCAAMTGSYSPILLVLAPVVIVFGIVGWRTKLPVADAAVSEN